MGVQEDVWLLTKLTGPEWKHPCTVAWTVCQNQSTTQSISGIALRARFSNSTS
jgi:hypothetical protein